MAEQTRKDVTADEILDLREKMWEMMQRAKLAGQVVIREVLEKAINDLVPAAKSAALQEVEARRTARKNADG